LANSSNNKIIDFIRIVAKEFNVDISLINLDTNNILFRESRIGDNTKIRKIFNYKPIFSVEKTIKRMLSYQNSNFFINN
jgi:nucleoside-diphosphate-sugar epimerase